MHYYKRNIGDYAKKAGRLSMLEHGAYTLLIDSCYDRERFPTEDDAIDWCWARTEAEITAVKFVLSRFFDLVDGKYVQSRISDEIAKYHRNAEINSRIATEREAKRTNRATTVNESTTVEHEPPPNQEPLTINQEPLTKSKSKRAAFPCPAGVDEQVWSDWLEIRKAKRQPLTKTALQGIEKEASNAGYSLADALSECCKNGWASFKASWLHERKQGNTQVAETAYQRSMRLRMQEAVPQIAAVDPSIPAGDFFRTIEMVEVVR